MSPQRSVSVLVIAVAVAAWPRLGSAASLSSASYPIRVDYDAPDLALAEAVLGAAEHAWQRQVIELGFTAPRTGGNGEPVTEGMIFLVGDTGQGAGAAMVQWVADVADTPQCDCSATITVDRATPIDSPLLAEGVYHELNHATEYANDCTEAPSAYEGFTVAAVHHEFPDSTIVPWTIEQFQLYPEYPLDYWTMTFPCDGQTPCFPYQLGEALFPLYLVDRFGGGGPALLATLFASFAQAGTTIVAPPHPRCQPANAPNWFEATDTFLAAHDSSLPAAFCEFSAWRAIVGAHDDGQHYGAGASYAEPAVAATVALGAGAAGLLDVREYGSRYLEVTGLDVAAPGLWSVEVVGDPTASWCASLLVWRDSQPVERLPLGLGAPAGSTALPSLDGVTRILLAVSQIADGSHRPDDMDYDNARTFTYSFALEGDGGAAGASGEAGSGAVNGATPTADQTDTGCACRIGARSRPSPLGAALTIGLAIAAGLGRRSVRLRRLVRG